MKGFLFAIVSLAASINLYSQDLIYTASRENWENCETGEGPCEEISIQRISHSQKVALILPCGGTLGAASLYSKDQQGVIQTVSVAHEDCPPKFDFTDLKDGIYSASMISCSLGGAVIIRLETLE